MTDGVISVNGVISPPDQAVVPALDRGLLFADNVFEVLVAFNDQILDIDRHLTRLRRSADDLEIDIPWSDADLTFELQNAASHVKKVKKNLRLVITRGNGMGLRIPEHAVPNRLIYALPANVESTSLYQNGVKLKKKILPLTERGAAAKTGNYLRSIMALKSVTKEGYDDVMWTNSEHEITECSTANIFFIGREGDLVEVATPAPASGILMGITRETMVNLLNKSQIPVTERIIYADEIPRFDEAFVCSTVRGLVPVAKIDDHVLHSSRQTSIYRQFERLFYTWVESQLGYRVNWNTSD
jgi:branched-chain amino acid aminotransferase